MPVVDIVICVYTLVSKGIFYAESPPLSSTKYRILKFIQEIGFMFPVTC